MLQSLRNNETKKGHLAEGPKNRSETAMSTGTKLDFVKYVVPRIVAFVGLTTISTVVMALPYISLN